MKHVKSLDNFEKVDEAVEFLKDMPRISQDDAEELAVCIRGLVFAYEGRNDDMSDIPGHPGAEAYLQHKMQEAKKLMEKYKIPEVLKK